MAHKYFIRFNELPKNNESLIYENGMIIGKREGISCFDAMPYKDANIPEFVDWYAVMPNKEAGVEEWRKYIMFNKADEAPRKIYILTGEFVDYDEMGCPIVKNPRVLTQVDFYDIYPRCYE